VRITAAVAEQLLLLHGDPDRGHNFVAALSWLGRDVVLAVPSCLAVTITHARLGGEISASTVAAPAPVLASLAVPLSTVSSGGLLILRAGEAGAFLLLADDLDGLLGPAGHPPIDLDEHLAWPSAENAKSLCASLADLSAVDQAIGVLVDRGLPPEAAHRELERRVGEGDTTIADVSRALLASPRSDPGHS
jgi:hypothetical protein